MTSTIAVAPHVAPASSVELDPRTRALLFAPIVPLLLTLAWPNVVVMLAQASTGLIETFWVSRLGTDALAGMALVFPGVMLMQMISAGSLGGGISSAIARALGARRPADADALVVHALIINIALGLLVSMLFLVFGPELYRALGGRGASLAAALKYSNVVFAGNVLLWVMNGLASAVRGTGNMLFPALVVVGGALILVPLSPVLIFGIGPFPALGIAGGGVAMLISFAAGAAVIAYYILSGRSVVRIRRAPLRRKFFADILERRRGRDRLVAADQHHDRHRDRARRDRRRPGRRRRIRNRRAAGVSADSAGLRVGRAAGRAGRHEHRRRSAAARAAHRASSARRSRSS